jgi:hypothetical protein
MNTSSSKKLKESQDEIQPKKGISPGKRMANKDPNSPNRTLTPSNFLFF